ncbi:class I SAM-dependent methyltransferase [Trueperella bialowiezensis]|uniref:Sarcosine/dimethylglycine N-methyltransferase n=1 Tax=Trueperella bialowiezensis TaxID=312285 RepID=A0A448PBW9_9ACTO|nr:class I SAM-dependent methyltransferase [Trueperella bialowiezensis]VEI12394.1 Sarcosine/dimethylglycine N-methyltransferase [Trueperella bialowiezensis]
MLTAGFTPVHPSDDPARAARTWWSDNAKEYLSRYGEVLGEADFIWGPEGLREHDVELLGSPTSLRGKRILEIGSGAAQCSRYLAKLGLDVVACDIAPGMVEAARQLNAAHGTDFRVEVADARALPYPAGTFDVVFTSFGALDFVADLCEVHREIRRVLKAGGSWVFSTSHPVKWFFADDPAAFDVTRSYFDRTPYLERDDDGTLEYAQFHHTLADHINALTDSGFQIIECVEPEWPAGRTVVWGSWGPIRSQKIPGTIIFSTRAV